MNTYIVLHMILYFNITSYLYHCISLITSTMFVVIIPIGSMYGIYANIWGILMVNVTIYSIHGSYGIYKCIVDPHGSAETNTCSEKRTTGEWSDQWQKSSQPIDENMYA